MLEGLRDIIGVLMTLGLLSLSKACFIPAEAANKACAATE
jgi:hypothetical protein